MTDPVTTALTSALDNTSKVANTPLFATVIDKMVGFKISEWSAQGAAIKRHILDGYEDAKQKGLGIQYVSAFRSNANLINTSVRAAKYIGTEVQANIEINNDVFWGLLEHSKSISNEEMQEVIAKILAGEYNVPGTYSMSTLQVLKMLGESEVRLFEHLCGFIINDDEIPQDLFNMDDKVKRFLGNLDFGSLQMLQSLGLFLPNEMIRTFRNPEGKFYRIRYFDRAIDFVPENEVSVEVGIPSFFALSTVGKQIRPHIKPIFVGEYFDWLKGNYKIQGYKLKD